MYKRPDCVPSNRPWGRQLILIHLELLNAARVLHENENMGGKESGFNLLQSVLVAEELVVHAAGDGRQEADRVHRQAVLRMAAEMWRHVCRLTSADRVCRP